MKFCRYCGAELNDDAYFCSQCGTAVEVSKSGIDEIEKPAAPKQNNESLRKVANVFIILGCILTGIGSYFIGFLWTIPLTIVYFNKRKKEMPVSVGLKVAILLLVSLIGGILLLVDKEE